MKKLRTLRNLSLFALLASAAVVSQAVAGGSTYSRFGVGDLVRYGGSRLDGMGGAGIALTGDGFLNLLNPAGIGKIKYTRFAGGYEFMNFSSTDALGNGRFARGAFKGASFGIPIDKEYEIATLIEASPYSTVNYATQTQDSVVQQDFYGTGGLSVLSFGGSVSPVNKLTLGAKLNYIYGRIRQTGNFQFLDASFTNSEIQRSDFYSGFNVVLGGIYEGIGDLLGSSALQPLTLGFILSTPTTLSVNHESVLTSSSSTDTTYAAAGTTDLPIAYGLGLSYSIANRFVFTADVYHQQWQNAKFQGNTLPGFRNTTRIGAGFEALPGGNLESFWKRVAYRGGMYYNATSYVFNGTPINEMFVTGGLGIPIGPEARLDVNLHLGTRGTTSNNLQRDTIVRLTVGVSASEVWFMKVEDE
ncbi:MAG: hypothetical protein NTU47_06495 [Ignavibacteriales bacterium]|nr:hypothetical protein [Ignavibacteriales bacterium]